MLRGGRLVLLPDGGSCRDLRERRLRGVLRPSWRTTERQKAVCRALRRSAAWTGALPRASTELKHFLINEEIFLQRGLISSQSVKRDEINCMHVALGSPL